MKITLLFAILIFAVTSCHDNWRYDVGDSIPLKSIGFRLDDSHIAKKGEKYRYFYQGEFEQTNLGDLLATASIYRKAMFLDSSTDDRWITSALEQDAVGARILFLNENSTVKGKQFHVEIYGTKLTQDRWRLEISFSPN